MDTTRRRILLASTTLALAVGACKDGGGSGLIDRGRCDVLIECASSLAPQVRDEYEAAYGEGGTCFGSADPNAWAACRDACAMALDAINQAAELTGGDTCGTCSSDADCSSFGAGASCDVNGFCVPGDGMAEGGTEGDPSPGTRR